jgi:hypothetical protein|tara:strand:- start:295 stop:801 length:507 start_codon:yes stop_codon:yes gene_type:complete
MAKKHTVSDIRVYDLYVIYKKKTTNPIGLKVFRKFFKEMFHEFGEMLIKGYTVKLSGLGKFSVIQYKHKLLNEDGELNKKTLHPDWKSTLKLWGERYGVRKKDEYKDIVNKPIIYYEPKDYIIYKFTWDKYTSTTRGTSLYHLSIMRGLKQRLSKYVLNPDNPKYYTA